MVGIILGRVSAPIIHHTHIDHNRRIYSRAGAGAGAGAGGNSKIETPSTWTNSMHPQINTVKVKTLHLFHGFDPTN